MGKIGLKNVKTSYIYGTLLVSMYVVVVGSDNKVFIWNVGMGEVLCEIDFPDIPLSCSWNYDGSRFAVACKDHKVRIVDPRTGKFIRVSWLVRVRGEPICLQNWGVTI